MEGDLDGSHAFPLAISIDLTATAPPNANQLSDSQSLSTNAIDSPVTSAPNTPSLKTRTPVGHRASLPAVSPLAHSSPRPSSRLQRTSSAASVHSKPPPSPSLNRQSSRSSLRAQSDSTERQPTPKKSISNLIAGLRDAHTTMEVIEEPVPLTAPGIATDHFVRELVAHSQPQSSSLTTVILHDSCYGHRFSRIKTTKSSLSTIVERPERILASALGVSAAYVRLGGHHAGGINAPHPAIRSAAPPPFKIRRTERTMDILSPFVAAIHGTAWMSELKGMCDSAGAKLAVGAKELERSSSSYEPEKRYLHETDLYLCPESLAAFQGALGGVAEAVDDVFDAGSDTQRAFVAIRPPGHHCSADYPSGFCWLNNVHVGIEYASQTHGLTHAAILDFDLHHGDGSQDIAWERNSKNNIKRLTAKANSKLKLTPDIGYYSLHDINSYPCENGDDEKVQAASLCIDDAHGQSVWNVHLQPWRTEDEFWKLYETKYLVLIDKAAAFLKRQTERIRAEGKVRPKAAIFISAGFDASEWEGQGMQRHKVNVPTEFYARFTRDVVRIAQESGNACNGRVISVLEGGYSDRALCSGVLSHLSGLCDSIPEHKTSEATSLDQLMNGLAIGTQPTPAKYDPAWWSASNLHELEMKVNPPPPSQGKKVRVGQQPTYATPTESFAYKVVDTDKFARSISGTMRDAPKPARPPTPPPPEVSWVVATQELSRLVIPADRQTKSCTAEELGGARVKKEQQLPQTVVNAEDVAKPRQLRDRKSKAPAPSETVASKEAGFNRRQTIAELPTSSAPVETTHQRRASRRLSASSALSSVSGGFDSHIPPVPVLPSNGTGIAGAARRITSSTASDLAVKKMRAPAKPTHRQSLSTSGPAANVESRKLSTGQSAARVLSTSANGDVDALTSGMKKVTLKLGTKEEHDRKQKEKLDAERRVRALKAAETRRTNAAAKKAAAASGTGVQSPTLPVKKGKENGTLTSKDGLAPSSALAAEPVGMNGVDAEMPSATTANPGLLPPTIPTKVESQVYAPGPFGTNPVATAPPFPSISMAPFPIPQGAGPAPSQDHASMLPPPVPTVSAVSTIPLSVANQAQPSMAASSIPTFTQPQQPPVYASESATNTIYPQPQTYIPNSRPVSRDQLPMWSSTGAIPFAHANAGYAPVQALQSQISGKGATDAAGPGRGEDTASATHAEVDGRSAQATLPSQP